MRESKVARDKTQGSCNAIVDTLGPSCGGAVCDEEATQQDGYRCQGERWTIRQETGVWPSRAERGWLHRQWIELHMRGVGKDTALLIALSRSVSDRGALLYC